MPKVLTRKNRDATLEKRTVPMLIGESKEEFHVHEEKLCLSSPYFRRRLQSKRKSLEDESDRECSICQESIDLDHDSLKFCRRQCGVNFHSDCVNEWLENRSTCPACRAQWVVPKLRTKFINVPDISDDGFGVYIDWLYNKRVSIPDYEDAETGQEHVDLGLWLDAYFAGVKVEDNPFCQALCHALVQICKQLNTCPSAKVVEEAYNETTDGAPLRVFLVNLFTQLPKRMVTQGPDLASAPAEFLADLLKAEFDADAKKPSDWDLEEVQRKICLDVHVKPRDS